jgi:hypothetical protein
LTKKFARCIVMPSAVSIDVTATISREQRNAGRRALRFGCSRRRKMKKTVLTIAGSALMVLSAVQFAGATEPHHGKIHHRATTEFRDSNAYAQPLYGAAAESEASRYSGGYSAPAGR